MYKIFLCLYVLCFLSFPVGCQVTYWNDFRNGDKAPPVVQETFVDYIPSPRFWLPPVPLNNDYKHLKWSVNDTNICFKNNQYGCYTRFKKSICIGGTNEGENPNVLVLCHRTKADFDLMLTHQPRPKGKWLRTESPQCPDNRFFEDVTRGKEVVWVEGKTAWLAPYRPNIFHATEALLPSIWINMLLGLDNIIWDNEGFNVSFTLVDELLDLFMKDVRVNPINVRKLSNKYYCFKDLTVLKHTTLSRFNLERDTCWSAPASDIMWEFKKAVYSHCGVTDVSRVVTKRKNVVFFIRKDKRNLQNLDQMIEILESYDLTVKLEYLPEHSYGQNKDEPRFPVMCEMVRALEGADVIISPHGAHLTNLLFARPNSVGIEIFPYAYEKRGYQQLMLCSGMKAYSLMGHMPEIYSNSLMDKIYALKHSPHFDPNIPYMCYPSFSNSLTRNSLRNIEIMVDLEVFSGIVKQMVSGIPESTYKRTGHREHVYYPSMDHSLMNPQVPCTKEQKKQVKEVGRKHKQ